MIPHCGFGLHLSDNEWCWAPFHDFVSHLYIFFGEISVWFFGPFLIGSFIFLVLSYMSCLYIIVITFSSVISLLLLSPILKALFSPCLKFSSLCKSFLCLIRSHLFIFAFISITLGGES